MTSLCPSPCQVEVVFSGTKSPPLFDGCVECIVALLSEYHRLDKHAVMIQALLPRVMGLVPQFQQAIKVRRTLLPLPRFYSLPLTCL